MGSEAINRSLFESIILLALHYRLQGFFVLFCLCFVFLFFPFPFRIVTVEIEQMSKQT